MKSKEKSKEKKEVKISLFEMEKEVISNTQMKEILGGEVCKCRVPNGGPPQGIKLDITNEI